MINWRLSTSYRRFPIMRLLLAVVLAALLFLPSSASAAGVNLVSPAPGSEVELGEQVDLVVQLAPDFQPFAFYGTSTSFDLPEEGWTPLGNGQWKSPQKLSFTEAGTRTIYLYTFDARDSNNVISTTDVRASFTVNDKVTAKIVTSAAPFVGTKVSLLLESGSSSRTLTAGFYRGWDPVEGRTPFLTQTVEVDAYGSENASWVPREAGRMTIAVSTSKGVVMTLPITVKPLPAKPYLKSVVFGFLPNGGCRYGCRRVAMQVCAPAGQLTFVNNVSLSQPGASSNSAVVRKPFFHLAGCRRHIILYAHPENLYGVGRHTDRVHVEDKYGQKSAVRSRSEYVTD